MGVIWALSLGVPGAATGLGTESPPQTPPTLRYHEIPLTGTVHVLDGDTFDADLNGDGRIAPPAERIRMLFVDTPELSQSHKGQDLIHGIPARQFLEQRLNGATLRLNVPDTGSQDRYGRTLALVEIREGSGAWDNVNLALVRAGHSPFDTRFGLPQDYDRWEAAEGEAFEAKRGIWADVPSRTKYLKRLRQELKTPAAPSNRLYVPTVLEVGALPPQNLDGRYVRLRGEIQSRRTLAKGVERLILKRGQDQAGFVAVIFPHRVRVMDVTRWEPGLRIELHGFVARYQGRPELQVHFGRLMTSTPK